MPSVPAISSRWPTAWRVAASVVASLAILLTLVNPSLGWFVLGGLALGWAVRHARAAGIALIVLIAIGMVTGAGFLLYVVITQPLFGGRPDYTVYRGLYAGEARYDGDAAVWRLRERLTLTPKTVAAVGIYLDNGDDPRGAPGARARVDLSKAERLELVRARLRADEWGFAESLEDDLVFSRETKTVPAPIGWWPPRSQHEFPVTRVQLDEYAEIRASDSSNLDFVTPARLIVKAVPPLEKPVGDATGERQTLSLDTRGGWPVETVKLTVNAPYARNGLAETILDFSFLGALGWLLLATLTVFQDEVKEILRACIRRLLRRAEPSAAP